MSNIEQGISNFEVGRDFGRKESKCKKATMPFSLTPSAVLSSEAGRNGFAQRMNEIYE